MKVRYIGTVTVVAASMLCGCTSFVTSEFESRVRSPVNEVKDQTLALSELGKLDKAEAHYTLGKSYVASKKWREAMNEFELALQSSPSHVNAANGKSVVLAENGLYKEALTTLQTALVINPEYAQTQSNLAYVLMKLNRLVEAAALMRTAYELDPKLTNIKTNWTELVRLSSKNSEKFAAINNSPTVTSPYHLVKPTVTAEVVQQIAKGLGNNTVFNTAVINIPEFPSPSANRPIHAETALNTKEVGGLPNQSSSSATVVNLNYDVAPSFPVPTRKAEIFSPAVAYVRERTLEMAEPPRLGQQEKLARLEIVNGNGTPGAAARFSRTLNAYGVKVTKLSNARSFGSQGTVVYYQRSQGGVARSIAGSLSGKVMLVQVSNLPGFDLRVVLGRPIKKTTI
jgi:hypothetical protein